MRGFVVLYSHEVSEEDRAHNAILAEQQISKGISDALLTLVPTKQIVESHLTVRPPPKEGTEEDHMTLLQSEQPVEAQAKEVADTPEHPAHVDIVARQEVLAEAAANDAHVAAQEAMQSAQVAVDAANEANDALPKKRPRRKLNFDDF
jgi:hypothetical protein